MARYVALLRGINVAGSNLIKMSALKACFEDQGFTNVATYIQSGNVVFEAAQSRALAPRLEQMLSQAFGYAATVVVRSQQQLRTIVDDAPERFGSRPSKFRYNVIFLKAPLTAAIALQGLPIKAGVDEADAGRGVLYFSQLIAKLTQSRLRQVIGQPIYQSMTIRNWNTTVKLLRLMQANE